MKIRKVTWRAYRIPFRQAFFTSGGARAVREGMIVRLETDSGLDGLGEIAPLRSGATRNIAAVLRTLEGRVAGVEVDDLTRTAGHLDAEAAVAAAIRCGLDIAACDLLAQDAGVPVAQLLSGRKPRPVPVNATIGAATPEAAARAARRAVDNGFCCVKLKVGMMRTMDAESELVGAVRDAIGADTLLRLDANQAWDADTAVKYIRELERFGLEFIEQPVPARDVEGLAAVRRAVATQIAADEAVTSLDAAQRIVKLDAADLMVIKPMVIGGLRPALEIMQMAARHGLDCVVTTTIDAAVGIAAALHLSAALGAGRACGLATAGLLESVLTSNIPRPKNAMMACPDGPGLGVEIDESEAAPYLDRP